MTAPRPAGSQLGCQGTGEPFVQAGTRAGRWVLATAVLGSGMAILDGTVVNVALRTLGEDLGASVSQVQWVVNAYLLALASLILTAGALGDRLGRRRIYLVGVGWFGIASILCAMAQSPEQLIVARGVQGVGAALLVPGSLSIIQGSFLPADRGRMIGQWAGLGSIAAAVGPPLGGWLLDVASWRWIFWINVPLCLLIILIGRRHVPESRDPETSGGHDLVGSTLAVVGLGSITYALIEVGSGLALPSGVVGLASLALFLVVEHRRAHPMLPLKLFRSRVFSVANGMTLLVYGALGVMLFFLVLQLQVVVGYSPLQAGLATLPITAVLLSLSSRSGALAARIGPRLQLSAGPVIAAAGAWLLSRLDAESSYVADVFPGIVLFALGMAALVAPLTTSVLAAAPDRFAGVASGVNNAVARTGSLLAVAALPGLVGLGGVDYQRPEVLGPGYVEAMLVCAALLVAGGLVSLVGLAGTRVEATRH